MRPRHALCGAVLMTLLGTLEVGAHRHEPRDLMFSFVNAANAGQADAAAELFEETADVYLPNSSFAVGRDEIRTLLRVEPFKQLGQLELAREPRRLRLFGCSAPASCSLLAVFDYDARVLRDGKPTGDYLLLTAVAVPTKVAETGEILEWSFASLRIIRAPDLAPQE